ncbi:helix-turn-helix transcriptional regulator [Geodermatophilus sabuli]|uniref:Regulatory protein, luxR family n=1 Tax=Geodermatophilus sabuli TaxID=1564158 RepID=A0A285EBU7_9ACTN|nr:helix-turn-helix transcriptional regulator [Geodermatophilus sabuli]MBB3084137.1 DNA-binding CsgD family transcriptional regulator [Geodermatophilus sabuli]SNX96589.1 regulatory protein, luxR family [Geodermatophilus sabuli]
MHSHQAGELLLAETAAGAGTTSERAQALLEVLRRMVPFDGAFLAFADPLGHGYHSLVTVDLDARTVEFLSGPQVARDIEVTGTDRERPPLGPSDLPYPAEELQTWAECLIPSGIHEGLGVALFARGGRHVGHLAVLSGSRQPPSPAVRRRLGRIAPMLAHGIDPMRSLVTVVHLVRGARAGVVLRSDGGCQTLPGMPVDALLVPASPLLDAARERIGDGHVCSSFLWPVGGAHAPGGHVRVTVLAAPDDAPPGLTAVALLSPATHLHGLTPRELEVLGLLVEGCSNQEIARALVVAPRTVAAHLEHVLVKLGAPTRTLAAVRAERDGLYVPASSCRRACVGQRESIGTT